MNWQSNCTCLFQACHSAVGEIRHQTQAKKCTSVSRAIKPFLQHDQAQPFHASPLSASFIYFLISCLPNAAFRGFVKYADKMKNTDKGDPLFEHIWQLHHVRQLISGNFNTFLTSLYHVSIHLTTIPWPFFLRICLPFWRNYLQMAERSTRSRGPCQSPDAKNVKHVKKKTFGGSIDHDRLKYYKNKSQGPHYPRLTLSLWNYIISIKTYNCI